MHWERQNVNPMLALRTTLCSEQWSEGRQLIHAVGQKSRKERFSRQQETGLAPAKTGLWNLFLRLLLLDSWLAFLLPQGAHGVSETLGTANLLCPPAPQPGCKNMDCTLYIYDQASFIDV